MTDRHKRDVSTWTEVDWEKEIVHHAREYGWLVHGNRAGRANGRMAVQLKGDPGFPDLVLCKPPHFLVIELKSSTSEHAEVAPEQQRWIAAMQACGVKCEVLWVPAQYDEIIRRLVLSLG